MSDMNEQLRADFEAHVRKDLGMPADCEFQWKAPWVAAAWEGAQWAARRAPAAAPIVQPVGEKLNTESSRLFLIEFMEQHFTDKTYHRYIRGDGRNALAGDFAYQMANAVRAALAASSTADAKDAAREPDMLWWAEDGEVFAHSADEFAKDYAYNNMARGETVDVRVDCAFRAKPERRTLRIGYVAGEDENRDRVECAWVDAAIASSAGEVKP